MYLIDKGTKIMLRWKTSDRGNQCMNCYPCNITIFTKGNNTVYVINGYDDEEEQKTFFSKPEDPYDIKQKAIQHLRLWTGCEDEIEGETKTKDTSYLENIIMEIKTEEERRKENELLSNG